MRGHGRARHGRPDLRHQRRDQRRRHSRPARLPKRRADLAGGTTRRFRRTLRIAVRNRTSVAFLSVIGPSSFRIRRSKRRRESHSNASRCRPTIQRMEASEGVIRGNVDSLMKLVTALDDAGIELINEGATSSGGGRGVRLRETRLNLPRVRGKSARPPAGRAA
jgi:hypothetical protein